MAGTKLIRNHHSLQRNLKLNGNYISNDGGDEGIRITDAGLVGIGVADPDTILEVYKVGTQLKLSGGDADYATFAVAADGVLTITTVGESPGSGKLQVKPFSGTIELYSGSSETVEIQTNGGAGASGASMAFKSILNSSDYFEIDSSTNGATILSTVDADAAEADLTLNIDGYIDINSAASEDITLDSGGDITLDAAGGDVNVLQADLTIPSSKKVILGAAEEYIYGDGTDIHIGVGSAGDINIPEDIGLTFGADTQKIEGLSSGNHLKIGAAGDITLDAEGDIILNANGGNISTADGLSAYTPSADSDVANKVYVDIQVNCPNIPIFFNETTTSRTYFRNADDAYNAWEWDGYSTSDSTSVDATIDIYTGSLMSGYVVPVACTLIRAIWVVRQANAVTGVAHFQIWTGSPVDDTELTLRTTNELSSNRVVLEQATSTVAISLGAGDMVYPAIQYVSGTSTIWYGSVTLMFERV